MCEIPPNIPSDFKNLASLARPFFPSLPLPLPRAHAQSGKNGLVHETRVLPASSADSTETPGLEGAGERAKARARTEGIVGTIIYTHNARVLSGTIIYAHNAHARR